MSRGDVVALQHDAGPASLLRCQSSPHSPWRQPVLALNQSEWFWINNVGQLPDHVGDGEADLPLDPQLDVNAVVGDGEGRWLDDAECPVRVLYMGHSETQLQGAQLSAGLAQPGLYSLIVRCGNCVPYPRMHLRC